MQRKLLVIFVIIVVLTVLGKVGRDYYLKIQDAKSLETQTSEETPKNLSSNAEETKNWKTFTNTTYKYSIKYPTTVDFTSDRFHLNGDKNRTDTADSFGPNLSLFFRNGNDPRALAKSELPTAELTDFEINNASGVKAGDFDYYLKSKNNTEVVIRITFNSQDYSPTVVKETINEMRYISERMLSTFRFEN